ncbi:MAG TPA: hemolysin family protein [Acidimicrobiales bacterium]|nr:hemolysin family protein [Acidimicrobiales bacterium]
MGAITVAVLLLAANAFFVAAEFALVAVRGARMGQLAAGGDPRARAAESAVKDLSFMLSAAQLGITMASLGLGFVAEPAVARLLEGPIEALGVPAAATHTIAFVIALTIVVFLHMVLGEMVPKNIAIAEPERSALWLALPMRAYTVAFRPLIVALNAAANVGLRLLGVQPTDELIVAHTGEEIATMLAVSRREGLLEEVEHRLMSGALAFAARPVSAVMIPREQVVAVGAAASVERVEEVVLDSGHSRLPVFGRSLDDVLGFVHAKDLLELPEVGRRRPLPPGLLRRMLVVPEDQELQALLRAMRRARLHFALVVSDTGTTAGIVTLEDVLEELVGDIRDEHDEHDHDT